MTRSGTGRTEEPEVKPNDKKIGVSVVHCMWDAVIADSLNEPLSTPAVFTQSADILIYSFNRQRLRAAFLGIAYT